MDFLYQMSLIKMCHTLFFTRKDKTHSNYKSIVYMDAVFDFLANMSPSRGTHFFGACIIPHMCQTDCFAHFFNEIAKF